MSNYVMVISMIFLFGFGMSLNAFADETTKVPKEYPVGISLKSVGEINKYTGSYELDLWYSIYSEGEDLLYAPPPEVEFINGGEIEIVSDYTGSNISEKRVQGKFVGPMDFHDFPFEKIHLRVEMEPRTLSSYDVIFTVDPTSGIDDTAIIPGWQISDPVFTVLENTHNDGETFSRYTADFTVERSPLGSFLKIIFPVLIVVAISFLAYIIPENHDIVAEYSLLPLVAVIFLHVDTVSQLPPIGYLTIFDKIILISYALIANNIVALAREIKVDVRQGVEASQQIQKLHLKITPVIITVLAIVFFAGDVFL